MYYLQQQWIRLLQDRISGDSQVVKVQGKATDNKALVQGGAELVPVLDLSLDSIESLKMMMCLRKEKNETNRHSTY